jgi:hypothetical protein
MKSPLHVAVENGRQEIIWLLLWFDSDLSSEKFPQEAVNAAKRLNIQRSALTDVDIRGLHNEQGETGEDVARAMGGIWLALVDSRILNK